MTNPYDPNAVPGGYASPILDNRPTASPHPDSSPTASPDTPSPTRDSTPSPATDSPPTDSRPTGPRDTAPRLPRGGRLPAGRQAGQQPGVAIVTTVLCCLPLGIVAIIKANSVDKLWAAGDFAGAQAAADEAKRWSMWGLIAGIVWSLIWVVVAVLLMAGVIGAASTSTYTYTPRYSYTYTSPTYPTY